MSKLFDLFWENSKFNEINIGEFQSQIEMYSGTEHEIPALQYPEKDTPLPQPNDGLIKQMRKRHSGRKFREKPVSRKQLGSLFSAFSRANHDGRTYPSAGALYPLEIFCLINNADKVFNKKIAYYNVDTHSLSLIKDLPPWDEYKSLLNIDLEDTVPSLVFIFVLFSERTTEKYLERGGRFTLIETGQAIQNLALRLVQEKMTGTEIGGLMDDKIKTLLGLEKTSARIALGYACGFQ